VRKLVANGRNYSCIVHVVSYTDAFLLLALPTLAQIALFFIVLGVDLYWDLAGILVNRIAH
jgi:hypothetical protein